MNTPSLIDFLMIIIPSVLGCLLGGIGTFQAFMFKSISNLKDDFNHYKVKIAEDHMTKREMRKMFEEMERRLMLQIESINRGNNK